MLQDLSTLTNIPYLTLQKLNDKELNCICHCVYESLLNLSSLSEIDIGIGKLYIRVEEDSLYYKFIPSSELENRLRNTVNSKVSPLIDSAEYSINNKIQNSYKELC